MIETFDPHWRRHCYFAGHPPELVASLLLDILDAMNRRMDAIESEARPTQS